MWRTKVLYQTKVLLWKLKVQIQVLFLLLCFPGWVCSLSFSLFPYCCYILTAFCYPRQITGRYLFRGWKICVTRVLWLPKVALCKTSLNFCIMLPGAFIQGGLPSSPVLLCVCWKPSSGSHPQEASVLSSWGRRELGVEVSSQLRFTNSWCRSPGLWTCCFQLALSEQSCVWPKLTWLRYLGYSKNIRFRVLTQTVALNCSCSPWYDFPSCQLTLLHTKMDRDSLERMGWRQPRHSHLTWA